MSPEIFCYSSTLNKIFYLYYATLLKISLHQLTVTKLTTTNLALYLWNWAGGAYLFRINHTISHNACHTMCCFSHSCSIYFESVFHRFDRKNPLKEKFKKLTLHFTSSMDSCKIILLTTVKFRSSFLIRLSRLFIRECEMKPSEKHNV